MRPLTKLLEALWLLGLAALFFGPLAVVNARPAGVPFVAQLRQVGIVLGVVVLYLCLVFAAGRLYHRRLERRAGGAP